MTNNNATGVNALNGLLSFLPIIFGLILWVLAMCQRPKRASFISTDIRRDYDKNFKSQCQRPKRASFISTVPPGTP